MVGEEVDLYVPFADLLSRRAAVEAIVGKGAEHIIAVQQQLSGLWRGDIMLVFPEAQSLELVCRGQGCCAPGRGERQKWTRKPSWKSAI